jgi:tetratricopeptide (TPR) repeat protein
LKDYENAISDFTQAIRLEPERALTYRYRGWSYHYDKESGKALADFSQAIKLAPQEAWCYRDRGRFYTKLEDYEKALADLSTAIELASQEAEFYRDRGFAYTKLKEYQSAIEDYNRAIELDPKQAWAYDSRGDAYYALEKYERAIEDYTRAIELDSDNPAFYYARAYAYLWLKDLQQAKADFTRCLELDTSRVQTHLMDTWVGMCQERPDMEMVQRLEEIITATPDTQRYGTRVCRGVSLWGQGSFEQALIEVEQSISLDPAIKDAYFWKGVICASLRRDEEAIAAIARALELKLPPVLLTPLRWLDEDRQDFCEKHVEPLLTRYNVLNHQETGE